MRLCVMRVEGWCHTVTLRDSSVIYLHLSVPYHLNMPSCCNYTALFISLYVTFSPFPLHSAVEEILVCVDGSQPAILQGLNCRGGDYLLYFR